MHAARFISIGGGLLALGLTGAAFGQETIAYALSLQPGIPAGYVETWEEYGSQAFVGGSSADGQVFVEDGIITWDVTVAASGEFGAANLVWTLVLLDANFTPVSNFGAATLSYTNEVPCDNDGNQGVCGSCNAAPVTAGFYSEILDGDCDGLRGLVEDTGIAPEIRQNAACTNIYDIGGDLNATIWALEGAGGPALTRHEYPAAMGFPPAAMASSGFLVGMGAGYIQFAAGTNTAGVGIPVGSGTPGCELGVVPIAEGQLSLLGLPGGTYYVELIPGVGNNMLEDDIDCNGNANSFAEAALTAVSNPDGMIMFTIAGSPQVVGRHLFYENSFYDTDLGSGLVGCNRYIACGGVANCGLMCNDDTAIDYDKNGAISQAADFDVARNNAAVASLTQALLSFTP